VLPVCELTLGPEPDAVPKARRFTAQWFADEPDHLVDDAEQVVSELVTNAILHGAEPVTLRLSRTGNALRLEVEDAGRTMPIVSRASVDTMTGRGLSLIAALASGWGVTESPGGKVVWAEISDEPGAESTAVATGLDLDLTAFFDEEVEPRYTVRLGAVSTELLLAAKAHIDNVVREMALLKAEQASSGTPMPEAIARLVEVVTEGFGHARAEIKRQALAAANRGDSEVELVLTLPGSAADAGERYLEALDAADRYARAARLLTVSAPVLHRVFRRWYVEALIDQLRAAQRGDPPPPPPAFPEALAAEVERLSSLDDTWNRLQLLQRITRELTGAVTVADITDVITRNALGDLDAQNVRVYLLGDDGVLRSTAVGGDNPAASDPAYSELRLDADLPGSLVVRTGTAMFFRNREQLTARFPKLAGIYPHETSLHVAPLRVGEHALGVLTIAFGAVTDVDEDTQTRFVGAMADALAQAFERALAMERADVARRRLAFLAEASVAFASSLDFEATLDAVTRLLVPTLADWCIVQLQDDDRLEVAALYHSDPGQLSWAKSMSGRFPLAGNRPGGAPDVVDSGESRLFPMLETEVIASMATTDEHRDVIRALGMSSAMVVPLTGRSGTFGAITLLYADSGRQYAPEDVSFVEDVARRAAVALETAETFREQSGRLADVRRVAEATQRAILAPVPPRLGSISLAGRYVSASAEALIGGDLFEVVPRRGGVRLLVGDVRGKGLTAIRIATIVLGEFRAAAADLDDLAAVAAQMDRRLRPYLSDEDFATAVVAEVGDDGSYAVVSCGHPAPQLFVGGTGGELSVAHALPLGLGAAPTATTGWLNPGDRLLLYTDGVNETRDERGRFVDLAWVVSPLESGDLQYSLDEVLERLHRFAGRQLGDDVALLVAEYRP
jgi:serine phosphatase RsbU (regulator of sigma subunit)